jgi:hypothetical protein
MMGTRLTPAAIFKSSLLLADGNFNNKMLHATRTDPKEQNIKAP